MRVTMEDIARHLNVSRPTVSRVLSGRADGLIGEETRQRVLQAAREMGYQPNRLAQALAGGRTRLIEICAEPGHSAFFARALAEIQWQLQESGYDHCIVNPGVLADGQSGEPRGSWPVDGILALNLWWSGEVLRALRQRGVPLVIASCSCYDAEVDNVAVDLGAGARDAVRHLLETGRRRIAHATVRSQGSREPRCHAYTETVEGAGLAPEVITVRVPPGASVRAAAVQGVAEHVRAHGCPDALFAFNDEMAIGALRAFRDLGVRVPEDVAVVGCDGIEDGEYQVPPLSTIVFPFAEVARLAWEFLIRRIEEPGLPPQGATLKPCLQVRESSAPR